MTTIYHTFKLHLFPKDNKNDIRAFKTNHPLKRRMHTGFELQVQSRQSLFHFRTNKFIRLKET